MLKNIHKRSKWSSSIDMHPSHLRWPFFTACCASRTSLLILAKTTNPTALPRVEEKLKRAHQSCGGNRGSEAHRARNQITKDDMKVSGDGEAVSLRGASISLPSPSPPLR